MAFLSGAVNHASDLDLTVTQPPGFWPQRRAGLAFGRRMWDPSGSMSKPQRIALIGFGEIGQGLARALTGAGGAEIFAYDPAFGDAGSGPSLALDGAAVRDCREAAQAAAGAELVVSAVSAGQGLEAARAAAAGIEAGAYYLDLATGAPSLKQLSAGAIEARGGRYVEGAAMGRFKEQGLATPLLLGGRYASAFMDLARPLGFTNASLLSDQIGRAAAAEICGAVLASGLKALLLETLIAARRYGVEDQALAHLQVLAPGTDWRSVAEALIAGDGATGDGPLGEAARALEEAGVEPIAARAAARRLAWAAAQGSGSGVADLAQALDGLLGRIDAPRGS